MQGKDLIPRFLQLSVIPDDVIGYSQAILAAGLCLDHAARLFLGFRVTCEQASYLGLLVAIDDQHAVDERPQRRLYQQGNNDQLIGAAGADGLFYRGLADSWMQNPLEFMPGGLVCEDKGAHCGAIKIAVGRDDLHAEHIADLVERGLTGIHDFSCDDVGVNDRHAEPGKYFGDGRLAARNAPGQADSQRLVI